MGYTYTKKLFIVYLKFQFNWVSDILSGSSTGCLGRIKQRIQ